ncbi:MAG: glutathione S-transferase family protein [Pseudomonadota bacterium]|nr:glutathione S-transferase family protein [Pseudomonadota bacterium]
MTQIQTRLELTGAPGSPYTRKMIAVLRYRQIPYRVFWGTGGVPPNYPAPKVRLLPTFFFPDGEDGELVPVTDSTPIIRRLESEHPGRSVIPNDPTLKFLNELIEDYADEWLTKAMFHFRWAHEADWKNAAPLLVYWNTNTAPPEQAAQFADHFAKRQIDRLYVVGSNDITAQTIEDSYERLIGILDKLIARKGFVLGARPSSADFALYGQLTQLAWVEPTSAAITARVSQRIRAWIDIMDDLSGLEPAEDDWFSAEEAKEALAPFLAEIGRTYAPSMVANARAINAGEDSFETEIDGRPWTQPVFKYQAKCLGWLREAHGELSGNERGAVDDVLTGSGCEILFE